MRNIHLREIRDALRKGSSAGFVLFPEIRSEENRRNVKQDAVLGSMAEELLQHARAVKEEAPPELPFHRFMEYLENGNRSHYERLYFLSKKDLHALVIAEILENRGEYIQAIQNRLWKWCNEYTWEVPAHVPLHPEEMKRRNIEPDHVVALFSAETGFYFAEILSLLGEKLHPTLVHRLKKEIFRRIIDSYRKRAFDWEERPMNWSSVCAGSVGCAALYLVEDVDELSLMVQRVIGSLNSYLSGFDRDGVTTEGLSYWSYGFSFYVYFAELLKERTGGTLDLMAGSELVRKIAELPLYLQFPDDTSVNFSDASSLYWFGEYGLLSRLASIFGIDAYRLPEGTSIFRDHTYKWAAISRNLFWGLEGRRNGNRDLLKTGSFYFPDSQWLIDRRIGGDGGFYAFAAKGGHNDEPHNHNDLGHFLLHAKGDRLFCDLGAPLYDKGFFSHLRYTYLHASSRGHSVPVINGELQQAGRQFSAEVVQWIEDSRGVTTFALDLTAAYGLPELENFTRTFIWNYKTLELEIRDAFRFAQEGNRIEEVLMTKCPVELSQGGTLKVTGETCSAVVTFSGSASCSVTEEAYLNHFAQQETVNRIVLAYESMKKECQITVKIFLT